MSAIVLISVLVLPIVYLFGLPQYHCELIASLGFGFGSIAAITLLFVPKLLTVYLPSISQSSKVAAIAAEIIMSSKKKIPDAGAGTGNGGASSTFHDSEAMLKGKSHEQRLMICQEQMMGWQALLMRQQAHAMDTSSNHSHSHSNSHCHSAGVEGSAYELPTREKIASSQLQPDMDIYPGMDKHVMFQFDVPLKHNTISTAHRSLTAAQQDLEMQDA
jgi:hypothetical protein